MSRRAPSRRRGAGDASARRFGVALAVIAGVALVARLVWMFAVAEHFRLGNDARFYWGGGIYLARHHGYENVLYVFAPRPSAQFPPGMVTYLGAAAWLFGISRRVAHIAVSVAGVATVVMTGVLGRRLAGARVGLIAAAVAAVCPLLLVADGTLMSETLFTVFVMASLVAAYRVIEAPSLGRWCVAGAMVALATLTRGEGLLLVVTVLAPVAWRTRTRHVHAALGPVVALVALVIVMAPWTIRNATTFHHPVVVANDSGTLVSGANCDETYHGSHLGYWSFFCDRLVPGKQFSGNEAIDNGRLLRTGVDYARKHTSRLPVVAAARLGRTFGVYQPFQGIRLGEEEGRPYGMALAAWISYLVAVPFAVFGAVTLVRRRVPIAPLVGVVVMVAVATLAGYGNTRFRTPMDPILVILAVIGATAVWERWSPAGRRHARTDDGSGARSGTRTHTPLGNRF